MRYVYYQNPLRTRVYLDDHEKEIFKLKIKIEQLENIVFGVSYHLKHDPNEVLVCPNQYRNGKTYIELAREEIPENWYDRIDEHVEELYNLYINDLENGYHVGDCTCIPCSCSKCHAESLLGIDTIKGLGKYEASKIGSYFSGKYYNFDIRTIDEVLEELKNYKVPPFEENQYWKGKEKDVYEYHAPRWHNEADRAYKWLLNYKEEKL